MYRRATARTQCPIVNKGYVVIWNVLSFKDTAERNTVETHFVTLQPLLIQDQMYFEIQYFIFFYTSSTIIKFY